MPSRQALLTVSVLLPTFNRAQLLGEAIDSVLEQTHLPLEIIILDDGSTDETPSVCAAYASKVKYVRISENGGKTAAINAGLELAAGNVIWVMDDDDIAPPDALKTLLAPLQADPKLGFTFGSLKKFTMTARGERVFVDQADQAPAGARHLFAHLMEDCFITGQPCALFRRRCFNAIAPFDSSITASVDYNILLQVARRHQGADVGQVVLWQRQHAGLRGPQAARHASHERVQRWQKFDARLLADLLPELNLNEFLDDVAASQTLAPMQARRALLQRAVIAGRKDLWDIALGSLIDGLEAAPGTVLARSDLEILSRLLGSRYGIDILLGDRNIQKRLATAANRARNGGAVRMAMASMLTYWAGQGLRRMDAAYIASCARALYRLAGIGGATKLVLGALNRRLELRTVQRRARRDTAAAPATYAGEERSTKPAR